jgi:hypothetical protein
VVLLNPGVGTALESGAAFCVDGEPWIVTSHRAWLDAISSMARQLPV